jgi:hypothetical protein
MTESTPVPLLTSELAQRLIAAERYCKVDWLRAMEAVAGNPFGIAIREFVRRQRWCAARYRPRSIIA